MKTIKSLSAFMAFSVLLAGPSWSQDAVTIKPKLNTGNKYTIRQTMNMTMPSPLGEGEITTNMEYDSSIKVAAVNEPAGHKAVGVGFEKMLVKMNMAGQEMVFDSSDPENQNPMLKMSMGPMMDMKFSALYNGDDEFVKVLEMPQGGAGMGMGEAEMRQMIDSMVNHGFPDKPLKVGDSWTHEIDMPMGQMGKMSTKMTYTYAGQAERNGKSYPKLTFIGEVGGEANAGGAAQIEFKDSEIKGWMLFDQEHGLARYTETDMNVTMSVGGADGAEMETKTSTVVDLIKIEKLKPEPASDKPSAE